VLALSEPANHFGRQRPKALLRAKKAAAWLPQSKAFGSEMPIMKYALTPDQLDFARAAVEHKLWQEKGSRVRLDNQECELCSSG